jgi:hypothetical protein
MVYPVCVIIHVGVDYLLALATDGSPQIVSRNHCPI